MPAKGTQLSRASIRKMMITAKRTTQLNLDRAHEQIRLRAEDPIERAKLALQRAGVPVFSHSLHVPGSTLIVVGNSQMTADAMVDYAERFGRW
jgi:hypothetical protein